MILTLTEYKTYPCYNATQDDAVITVLLEDIEADIKFIQNKDFYTTTATTTDTTAVLSDIDNYTGFKVNDYLYSTNLTGKIIDIDSGEITLDTSATATATDVKFKLYPAGYKRIAAYMINYQIENFSGITSESIAQHSTDYGDMILGYPASVIKGIKRFL